MPYTPISNTCRRGKRVNLKVHCPERKKNRGTREKTYSLHFFPYSCKQLNKGEDIWMISTHKVSNQDFTIPPKGSRRSNYNKHTRVWLRKGWELLQREFDRERLILIATCRPVKPRIISSVVLTKRYQLRDQWDKIQLRASGVTQPKPPLMSLVIFVIFWQFDLLFKLCLVM